jgi:hypothetical protein
MKDTLTLAFFAFCLLFIFLLVTRMRLEKMKRATETVITMFEEHNHFQKN